MDQTKSYRIRTTPSGGENTRLNITLEQDYDFIDILSLKLNQKNLYTSPVANYGCIIGRVIANGGVGVPNAHVSIFIPAREDVRTDIIKRVLYPYDTPNDKNYKKIKYNLLQDRPETADTCYQVVGSLPLKRTVLDNNSILEIFNDYYKYTTVTNSHGDYILFGVPTGNCQIHCDVDISDCGILSQKPRDMFYKGYTMEQFESSTQFKKDTNLNNLAQIFTEDSSVFVYPFWGNENENEVGITRYDINISYRFETTCIFLGCCVTDSDNATTYPTCQPQKEMGKMSELTSKMGTIEMIRIEPNGGISNVKIKGNQLIDGNGVFCYQIPMNLDYVTTDEMGNEIISDNPDIGIATRTDVRFKFKLEGGDDNKLKACHLVPHNPEKYKLGNEVSYKLDEDTPKSQFVSMFKNNVYSVKSYIPRLQNTTSLKSAHFLGIKFIEGFGTNTPFPYNDMSSRIPIGFTILCAISLTIIKFVNIINTIIGEISCFSCPKKILGVTFNVCKWVAWPFCQSIGRIGCMSIDSSWCPYMNIISFPGCPKCESCPPLKDKKDDEIKLEGSGASEMNNRNTLENCVVTALAEEMSVSSFHFSNNWINGCLYFPTFNYKKKRKKRVLFWGLFGKKRTKISEQVCSLEDEKDLQLAGNKNNFFDRGVRKHIIFKLCSPSFAVNQPYLKHTIIEKHGGKCIDHLFDRPANKRKELKNKIDKNICLSETSYFAHHEPFINRIEVDIDKETGESIYEYFYRPITIGYSEKTGIYANLLKTDIILIGTIDDCNKGGIWQLHSQLPITTFQMPGAMYEVDLPDPEAGDKTSVDDDTTDEENISDKPLFDENSLFVASGKNWGYKGGERFIFEDGGVYRFNSGNNSGGLFFGVGCVRFETKIKTCANLNRICQLGVDLDIITTREDLCSEQKLLSPQGFIGKDQLITGYEIRQKFASLNHNRLNTYDMNADGTLNQRLVFNNGKRYYNFKYLYPNNFDSMLAHSFRGSMGENNDLTTIRKDKYNTANETYIDKHYFNFIYGKETVTPEIALNQDDGTQAITFFQPKNSFYFYFGLKSGSTAIEVFRQKYFATCFQDSSSDTQIQITVVQHPYVCCCDCSIVPPTVISVNVIGVNSNYNIKILDSSNDVIFTSENDPEKHITSEKIKLLFTTDKLSVSDVPYVRYVKELVNPGTYTIIFIDEFKNSVYKNVTLVEQNKISFRLEQKTHIYGDVDCNTDDVDKTKLLKNDLFVDKTGGLKAKVILKNLSNIKNKGCKLKDYDLEIYRTATEIGVGAQFQISQINSDGTVTIGGADGTTITTVKVTNGGEGYVKNAIGQLGSGGAYIKVKTVGPVGNILTFTLVNDEHKTNPNHNYGHQHGYSASDLNKNIFVERMTREEDPIKISLDQTKNGISNFNQDVLKNYDDIEDVRFWGGITLFLCVGDYSICLKNKHDEQPSPCAGKDEHCEFIAIKKQPPIELTFHDKIKASRFKQITRGGISYSPNGRITSSGDFEDDNKWWDEFFLFLRSAKGKTKENLVIEFGNWYKSGEKIPVEDIDEYIKILQSVFMPICKDKFSISLGGSGYATPYVTLLYGGNIDKTYSWPDYILTANDSVSKVRFQTQMVDVPYQSQESTLYNVLSEFKVMRDNNTTVSYPVPQADRGVNLTPGGIVFTTIKIPVENDTNTPPKYTIGGYYAGVIGENGSGNAAGYTTALTSVVKGIRGLDEGHQVTCVEVKNKLTDTSFELGDFVKNANKFLFKFHILDQTLKIFKEWNKMSSAYEDYYEPDECNVRYVPAYVDIYYVNGPLGVELTANIDSSPFDVTGAGINDGFNVTDMEIVDIEEDETYTGGEIEEDFMASVVTDTMYHLGTCPSQIPNARHFYSTSRFITYGELNIEQRTIIEKEGEEQITVIIDCDDKAAEGLDIKIKNTKIKVFSHLNCTGSNIIVNNHYTHSLDSSVITNAGSGLLLNPTLSRFDLYEIPYSSNLSTSHCHGYGASLKWITSTGGTTYNAFVSIWKARKKMSTSIDCKDLTILTPGRGYNVGDKYSINNGGTTVVVTVTGSVQKINIVNWGAYVSNTAPNITITFPSGYACYKPTLAIATVENIVMEPYELEIGTNKYNRFRIASISISNPGAGFDKAPTVTVSGGNLTVPSGHPSNSVFGAVLSTTIGGGGPNGELESFAVNTLNQDEWTKGGQLLRSTQIKGGIRWWGKITTPKTTYEWGTDLYCTGTQGGTSTTPEDLLYFVTYDTWVNRYNFPYYTKKSNAVEYAGIMPQRNEPNVDCGSGTVVNEDYTKNTLFNNIFIEDIMNTHNPNNKIPKTNAITILSPFNGDVIVPTLKEEEQDSNWNRSIYYNIIHDNVTGVRAFSQPMDFGNYVYIDENLIEYVPNYSNGTYTVNITVEIRGRLAFACHGYTYRLEEGNYQIEFPSDGTVNSITNNGWELIDTKATKTETSDIIEYSDGAFSGDIQRIRLEPTANPAVEYPNMKTTKLKAEGLRFSCTDKEKLIRISVKDISGVENYTYISLFRHIDKDENLTYCVYNCNNELKKELNTGFVINFEWKNNPTKDVGQKIVYITKTPVFPADSVNPTPVIIQGKNLIKTNSYGTNSGGTTLSDGNRLDFNYTGEVYLWFNPNTNHIINKVMGDTMTPQKLNVISSSCFILYPVSMP